MLENLAVKLEGGDMFPSPSSRYGTASTISLPPVLLPHQLQWAHIFIQRHGVQVQEERVAFTLHGEIGPSMAAGEPPKFD